MSSKLLGVTTVQEGVSLHSTLILHLGPRSDGWLWTSTNVSVQTKLQTSHSHLFHIGENRLWNKQMPQWPRTLETWCPLRSRIPTFFFFYRKVASYFADIFRAALGGEKSDKSDLDTALYNRKMLTAKIRLFSFLENFFIQGLSKIKNYKILFAAAECKEKC